METTLINQENDLTVSFVNDYNKIVHSGNFTSIDHQWSKKGDGFDIFTLYNDNTPVIASSSTTIIVK